MHCLTPLFLVLTAFVTGVRPDTKFVEPSPLSNDDWSKNPNYYVGYNLNIQWETDLNVTELVVRERYPSTQGNVALPYYFLQLTNFSRSTSYLWRVSLAGFSDYNIGHDDAVFQLELYSDNDTNSVASSQYFNVTTYYPKSKNSLSNKAVAGIAVGSTIAGILILGGLGFLAWRRFRNYKTNISDKEANDEASLRSPDTQTGIQTPIPPNSRSPEELDGNRKAELADEQCVPDPKPQPSPQRLSVLYEVP